MIPFYTSASDRLQYVLRTKNCISLKLPCHLLNVQGVNDARLEILTVILLKNPVFWLHTHPTTQCHIPEDLNLQVLMTSGTMK